MPVFDIQTFVASKESIIKGIKKRFWDQVDLPKADVI